jgi:DNA-directed RNA polymerase specialized sigma24 family protein
MAGRVTPEVLLDLSHVMEEFARTHREQRFIALFDACYGPVLAYARRRVHQGDADDVVAETFLAAWRNLDGLSDDPLPWLYRVASHAIANQRRGATRRERLRGRVLQLGGPPWSPTTPLRSPTTKICSLRSACCGNATERCCA